jgi:chromate transporter
MTPALPAADLLSICLHFMVLGLLSVGGAMSVAPDMHRYLVLEHGWLNDSQFSASIALAQAAPGPNVLFVAVLGYNMAGLAGAAATMLGILVPTTLLTLAATRWGQARRHTRGVRAFTSGMAPLTLGLLVATGWVLAQPTRTSWGGVLLVLGVAATAMKTRIGPLWLIAMGAVVGMLGWV